MLAVEDKTLTVGTDRDIFGRLLVVAKSRDASLKHVLTHELSPVP